MLRELFNPQNYYWNPWAIPMFVTGLLLFSEGVGVYLKNARALTNKMYFVWGIFVTMWLSGTAMVYLCKKAEVGLFWYKHFAFIGVAFLSFGSYLFSLSFLLNSFFRYRILILGLILISSIFSLVNINTDLIVKGMYQYYWGLYPKYAIFGGGIFLAYWVALYLATVVNLVKAYRQTMGTKRKQMLIILWATMFVYSGAADYLSAFGIAVYPFGYISAFLYFAVVAYVIIRYRAFEIDTVIHRTILWMLTSGLIFIPICMLLFFIRPWLVSLNWIQLALATTTSFYVYLYYYHKIQPRIDHLFRRRKYDYQTILGKVAEKVATTINIEDLARQFLTEVCEVMYLRNSVLYVLSKDGMRYLLIGRWGYKEMDRVKQRTALEIYTEEARIKLASGERELSCDNPLCQRMMEHPEVLEREQVEIDPQYENIKEESLIWFREQQVEIIVPLVFENKANAILGLGKKENLQAYTVKDIELLKKLGQEVGVTVFNVLHYKDLLEKERLEEEMKMGRQIQMALLPQNTPRLAGLNIQGLMQPAKEIGGDYYDFITLAKENKLAIVIGDVSGKGVAAGLLMAMAKTAMHAFSQEGVSPKQILLKTNQILNQHIGGQKFMTLLYLLWQPQTKSFLYSSAGHEHILIYRNQSQRLEIIQSGGFMLGILPDIEAFLEERQIETGPKDKILLYTDGVTEAENENRDRFGFERLKEAFKRHSSKTVIELMQAVKDEVYAFIGNHPQYDDITLVVLEAQ